MSKLPVLSGKDCIKILKQHGFEICRQKGSHIVLKHLSTNKILTIPNHKELDKGTLKAIVRHSGLSAKIFFK